jgi:hypothetical protein
MPDEIVQGTINQGTFLFLTGYHKTAAGETWLQVMLPCDRTGVVINEAAFGRLGYVKLADVRAIGQESTLELNDITVESALGRL